MSPVRPLSDLFKVKARFCRSINITADVDDPDALIAYVVTPLTRAVLRRVGEGLRPGSRARAWSVTGPYGAGKSACALFLAKVLGYPQSADARQMLRGIDAELYDELCERIPGLASGGFFVTLLVGSREPIAPAIIRGMARALLPQTPVSREARELVGWLESLDDRSLHGHQISVAEFTEAIERTARFVRAFDPKILGVLIIIDELGKLLEHATFNPASEDVFYLQALAELAARSGDNPVGVLAILHQAFEHYAARLGFLQQQEWGKVQGRFEDIPFLESPGELLRLIGEAIEPEPCLDGLSETIGTEAVQAGDLGIAPPELGRREAAKLLERCAPLHPTVALVLGQLFRSRLAQNERSLFAFLTSGEVHGLQSYLRRETWTGNGSKPFYRLDELYDYVVAALGSGLYVQARGKRWAEIADALGRLPVQSTSLDARLIKSIGLLGILGDQSRLKASKRILSYALADGKRVSAEDVHRAIDRLVESKIAVYRRHRDAYGLWEGSDIDLDEQLRRGLAANEKSTSLADLLRSHAYLRPYVAKRHLHETGTLRHFVPWVVDAAHLDRALNQPFEPADGVVVFVVDNGGTAPSATLEAVLRANGELPPECRDLFLFAIPRDAAGLREALEEVRAWEWVVRNTEELHGDSVAREELKGRLLDAQGRVNELCAKYFDKTSSYSSSLWVWAGRQVSFSSPAALSATISTICDQVYHRAPRVHNELVNRRALSSAAAAARRTLIERMLANPTTPRLGIIGFPPELSMYRSVLERTGLHHQSGDRWEFGPSSGDDPYNVRPLWQGIEEFLDATEGKKRAVSDLFEILRQPPYGIKHGLLPIFLAAAVIHWDQEIALYENGSFIPKVDIAAFERLMKAPHQFAIQRYRLGEARSYLFERYSALFKTGQTPTGGETVLGAIRPIIAFVRQLPPYTSYTSSLSSDALAVREAISKAREPHRLLFVDLPSAVGVDPERIGQERGPAEAFVDKLRMALAELAKAYDLMLDRARVQLCEALRLPADAEAARKEITERTSVLRDKVTDLRLKAFLLRLGDGRLPEREWLESVLSYVANKPPKQWNDQDIPRYGIALAEMAGQFLRVEQIVAERSSGMEKAEGTRTLRVGFTAESGEDHSAMVRVTPAEEQVVEDIVAALQSELDRRSKSKRIHAAVVAELVRRAISQSAE